MSGVCGCCDAGLPMSCTCAEWEAERMSDASAALRLFSDGLLSKWGFSDGDMPDGFLDWCDEQGVNPPVTGWHTALIFLVMRHLVPALDQKVDIELISTSHNPIRAVTVDGADVTRFHTSPRADDEPGYPRLTPEYVEVPYTEVLRALQLGADEH